jgi:hypothetical protein
MGRGRRIVQRGGGFYGPVGWKVRGLAKTGGRLENGILADAGAIVVVNGGSSGDACH